MTPILVCGSRTFDLTPIMAYVMGPTILSIKGQIEIVEGGAPGADMAAYCMATSLGWQHKQFKADWDLWGKAAGPMRNEEMAVYCAGRKGYCFAFWDGQSRGTADMIRRAKAHGIETIIHEYMPREFYFRKLMQEWQDKLKKHATK